MESQVEAMTFRALKMLVLLHRPKVKRPSGTVEWLNARNWLTNHTHVQGTSRLFVQTPQSQMVRFNFHIFFDDLFWFLGRILEEIVEAKSESI